MYTKAMFFSMALMLSVAVACLAAGPGDANEDGKTLVEAMNQFYASLNTMFTGDATPMTEVWSHADDVTYMGPAGGIQLGWEKVRAEWEEQAALKLGGHVEAIDVHMTVGDDLAIVQCYEKGTNRDADGRALEVSIRATNVFRKENSEWKMIGHHTDLLPFLTKETVTSATD